MYFTVNGQCQKLRLVKRVEDFFHPIAYIFLKFEWSNKAFIFNFVWVIYIVVLLSSELSSKINGL